MPGFGDPKTYAHKAGLTIWRIEKMEVNQIDPKSYGTFFSGDCYIVLKTIEKFSSFVWDLYFWIGKDSSQDEQGAVAYKTVELDDLMGGAPIQHREVEGHESAEFLSCFPKGIKTQAGGVASAFKKVDRDAYETRLFQIKGKRNVRCIQVPLAASSLNHGDVFILDAGLSIYQWNGKEANKYEKHKGLEIATKIKDDERGGKAQVIHQIDDKFWKALGGSESQVKSAKEGGDDDQLKADVAKLFRISDATGRMEITQVGEGKLEKSLLDQNDVFLLDSGAAIFVWVGKNATKDERAKGMQYGQQYLVDYNRPSFTPITRVPASGETPVFKSYFQQWDRDVLQQEPESKAAESRKLEVQALYKRQQQAEEKMVDNATGKVVVSRIENLALKPIGKSEYGQFFSGDSYIVHYSYKASSGKEAHIIYYWQGRDSSTDETAASALLTVDLADSLKTGPDAGEATQVRVVQNKEPNHFLTLFKGKMVIHTGGVASSFNNSGEVDTTSRAGTHLYHIRGSNAINTRAVEVHAHSSSLNSGDCFTLLTDQACFVWMGRGSNDQEKQFAQNASSLLQGQRPVYGVEEGSEPAEFWDALGGQGEYPSSSAFTESAHEPRLFQMKLLGDFAVEEIFNFSQDDLINDDVMLLDTYSEVYVWIGHDSSKEEKDLALSTALQYVANAPDGRSPDTPVYKVTAGNEPPTFTAHFLGWDNKKAIDFSDPYQKRLAAEKGTSGSSTTSTPRTYGNEQKSAPAQLERVTQADIGYADPLTNKFTLAQLKSGVPQGVDPKAKEKYLANDQFHLLFNMDIAAFNKLAAWKREELKKKHGIF